MTELHRNYVAGEWVEGADAAPNINPSDVTDVVGMYARADRAQAEKAIAAARAAFPAWSMSSVQERANLLDAVGSTLLARKDELGRLLSREEAKLCVRDRSSNSLAARRCALPAKKSLP